MGRRGAVRRGGQAARGDAGARWGAEAELAGPERILRRAPRPSHPPRHPPPRAPASWRLARLAKTAEANLCRIPLALLA
ncbi:hypothetical protein VULLAG_LOCUS5380 [Vulpes lagopus]